MGHKVTTPPATEPVTLAEARAHLKVDGNEEDPYIESLIAAARESCEVFQGRAYVEQTITLKLDEFPCNGRIEIPRPPLISIESLTYVDGLGDPQELDEDEDFYVDDSSENCPTVLLPAYGKSWPSIRSEPGAITIVYKAGYGAGAVPKSTKQAILFLVGHWFENREAVNVGNLVTELPIGVDRLLLHHKVYTIP